MSLDFYLTQDGEEVFHRNITQLFAQQPRKAVKLTHHQITECHPVLYGLDDDTLAFARAIEAAVLKANGVEQ